MGVAEPLTTVYSWAGSAVMTGAIPFTIISRFGIEPIPPVV